MARKQTLYVYRTISLKGIAKIMSDISNPTNCSETYDELIGGKWVAMSPRPLTNHDTVAENIHFIFRSYLNGKKCMALAERNVYLDEENMFIPDAMILCDRKKQSYRGIEGAPDLVVEVISRSTQKNDRYKKKLLYEKYGVREYWLVSVEERTIEVYLLTESVFVLDQVYADYPEREIALMRNEEKDAVIWEFSVSFLPGLRVRVKEVFFDLL